MINSMTGFGRCESSDGDRKFTVEMKGVNHRYLDVNIRMPKKLNLFETAIRNLLKQSIMNSWQGSILLILSRWKRSFPWGMIFGFQRFCAVRRCSPWKSRR